MTGFLGEIERRRQQEILNDSLKRKEIPVGRRFIEENAIIINILERLYKFGYKSYFEGVGKISGLDVGKVIYRDYSGDLAHYDELYYSVLDAKQLRLNGLGKLGWGTDWVSGKCQLEDSHCSTDTMFFGDSLLKSTGLLIASRSEPKGASIGVRFSNADHGRIPWNKGTVIEESPVEDGSTKIVEEFIANAAYIRIFSDSAIITGSDQQRVELSNIKLFDEYLESAIKSPARVSIKETFYVSKPDNDSHNDEHSGYYYER